MSRPKNVLLLLGVLIAGCGGGGGGGGGYTTPPPTGDVHGWWLGQRSRRYRPRPAEQRRRQPHDQRRRRIHVRGRACHGHRIQRHGSNATHGNACAHVQRRKRRGHRRERSRYECCRELPRGDGQVPLRVERRLERRVGVRDKPELRCARADSGITVPGSRPHDAHHRRRSDG